jgi:DNA helicase IV
VIDEAQDLSPMQLRMVARRAPTGSITILGDLAQATGGWAYDEWDSILRHLPSSAPLRREELTLGYRAPGQVLDFASRLLPLAAPTVTPTRSIRVGSDPPGITRVGPDRLLPEALREAARLADGGQLVGVVMTPEHLTRMTVMAPDRAAVGLLDRDGIARPITLVTAQGAKGLEFDAVVVVEPAAIAGDDRRGLRRLYVAMTRPIRHLSIVHSEPLPEVLRSE